MPRRSSSPVTLVAHHDPCACALLSILRGVSEAPNFAGETLAALCRFVGCVVSAGPKSGPDEHPYVERFFSTVASKLSSRLPGYTGSHPRDLCRALADPKGNLRLYVSLDELDELIDYSIATCHGTPHLGLNGVTPLEAMKFFVREKGQLLA